MRLLIFETKGCKVCEDLTQTLRDIKLPFPVEMVDVSKDIEAAMMYGIKSMPTLILLDENQNIITKVIGNAQKKTLNEAFNI